MSDNNFVNGLARAIVLNSEIRGKNKKYTVRNSYIFFLLWIDLISIDERQVSPSLFIRFYDELFSNSNTVMSSECKQFYMVWNVKLCLYTKGRLVEARSYIAMNASSDLCLPNFRGISWGYILPVHTVWWVNFSHFTVNAFIPAEDEFSVIDCCSQWSCALCGLGSARGIRPRLCLVSLHQPIHVNVVSSKV